MTYLVALGGFDPRDEDAAIKFVLNIILLDNRLRQLVDVVDRTSNVAGLEGDPGWRLERRDANSSGWPESADYRVYVEPQGYALSRPEWFSSRQGLREYLVRVLPHYLRNVPSRTSEANALFAALK
jgi:hypothetical protein